jgi:hypothetical protein
MQIKFLRTIAIFQGAHQSAICTQLSNSRMYTIIITKLCRKQAEVRRNYENEHVRGIGKCEARQRKYKKLKLGGGKAYDPSSD